MKLFALCVECLTDPKYPAGELIAADYYEDGFAIVTCSAGHKIAHLVQSAKFEILLEAGSIALLEGFTFEACASFSTALERFLEYGLRVVCKAHGLNSKLFTEMFKHMTNQSERQLGAFMLVYAMDFGEAYNPPKISELRNKVIHKGEIPTIAEAKLFASMIYETVFGTYRKLHGKHEQHMLEVLFEDLQNRQRKVPEGMKTASNTATMFFKGPQPNGTPDFEKALEDFNKARQLIMVRPHA